MCFGRSDFNSISCPHLREDKGGAMCGAGNDYVRNIEDVSIKFCMSERFEICHVYRYNIKQDNIDLTEYSLLAE